MNNLTRLISTAAVLAALGLVALAMAETVKRVIVLTEVNPVVLASGWRATDSIGADV
jgi:hypothetical protein